MTSPAAPPAEDNQQPLSESIAAATRSVHAKLNKLIIARLPLAIPPRAADPSIYVSGLLHIAPIYATFESLWKTIAEPPMPTVVGAQSDDHLGLFLSDPEELLPSSSGGPPLKHQNVLCERMRSILTSLYLPGLMRSDRLRSDITSITGWSPEVVEEQLKAVSESGRLAEFTQHVKRTIEKKPHVLMAYSYILFMALFAGGRFIRATLESAGSEFWAQVPSPIPPSQTSCQTKDPSTTVPASAAMGPIDMMRGDHRTIGVGTKHSRHSLPLGFFHFATVLDGEDLKKEFKKRLSESESLLTSQERNDIIQEAVCIFDNMLLLVGQLDNICETNLEDAQATPPTSAGRLRDSLVVTRERKREKTASKGSEDGDTLSSWLCRHAKQKASETMDTKDLSDLEKQPPACCSASRSMRFEPKLPVPHRKEHSNTLSADDAPSVATPQQRLLSRSAVSLMSNIILVAGLAAVVSMIFLARRSADEGLAVEEEW
ncbi:heme-binding protein HMX1 [Colletotrichum liriopes]|uniref:Heme-binding protein HMX1 n=1 Tax=Colletotrichum liriopes TaxID=708192 RepID=A0AA37GJH1_9PEZI|nr:heme-binding protein HMX1 [Colletotrichum liriopes]